MSSRTHGVAASLAAMATLVVAMPLTALFRESAWLPTAALGVLVVMVTGIVLRGLARRAGVTILGQLLAGTAYVLVTQLGGTTVYGIVPTTRTVPRLLDYVYDARETITTYAAPAPESPGVSVMLVIIVVVVGLAVDMSAATAASPSVAGLPLLSLFLVSAANSGGALPWGWFAVGGVLWLAMVANQHDRELREWMTAVPLMRDSSDAEGVAERSLRWQAARLAAVCLAAAVLVPPALPHLPTRYVLDGLGAGGAGSARSTDGIRLSTELDLKRSLASPSEEPVLRYTTDDPTPEPLRVAVVTDFRDGFGRMRSDAPQPREGFQLPAPAPAADEGIPREERAIDVEANGVAAPQIALPLHLTEVDTGGLPWALGTDGSARVQRTPGSYSSSYLELDPQEEDFGTGAPRSSIDLAAHADENLALDPASAETIQELAASLAPQDVDDLKAAQAFQEYLRGSQFAYDLEVPDPPGSPDDPILSFLETKVGYCQQFASTMTLLARAHGIPARVVVGFLPGTAAGTDERVIRASDAHAWPELYFHGVGWTRFEPTPGARAASVPSYSIALEREGAATSPESTTTSETTTTTTQASPQLDDPTATDQPGGEAETFHWRRWLLGLLLVVAALGLMPVSAWLARRRDRATAGDAPTRIEAEWEDLLERLDDLGLRPPVGATPRRAGDWVSRHGYLDEPAREQLDHVVVTVERARYGRPDQQLPDIRAEVSSIVGEVRQQRMAGSRLKAALWPRAGVDAWLSLPQRLVDVVRRR
ncbi:transglutaminaseTgpA domain-containing protein [Janibacter cremeus]|uniref:Transglutaminase-like putative cysteine protease n=1 Tax=Janibacter cremeus TaxID=1285192 RepID=A0A852VN00_9MICO|nr:transglutaminase domain-containing protein [Janibacter cremeus]NYF97038.1 transglutaminase-like putative cysteine protease [Janibacter cremeus]